MAKDVITVINYVPVATKTSHQQKALQTSTARAHAARVYHLRKRGLPVYNRLCKSQEPIPRPIQCKNEQQSPDHDENDSALYKQAETAIDPISSIFDTAEKVALNFTLVQLIEGSYFEYLPSLYANASPGSTLETATHSLALACFARWAGRDDVTSKARQLHQKALRQMRMSLNDTALACADETLATVLLIAHIQLVAEDGLDEVSQALIQHLEGAKAILQTRISRGVRSQVGDQIFLQIWDKILMQSYARKQRLPAMIDHLLTACTNPEEFAGLGSQPRTRELPRRMTNLRAGLADKSLTDPVLIINETLDIIIALSAVHDQMVKVWPYSTVESDPPLPGSFQGIYHVYHNGQAPWRFLIYYCMATVWMRSIIIEQLRNLCPTESPWSGREICELLEVSENEIEKSALKVCACIPQHLHPSFKRNQYQQIYLRHSVDRSNLGKVSNLPKKPTLTSPKSQDRFSECSAPPQRLSSACSLIWPLYVVGGATQSTALRQYVIERLRYIASSCRIQLAATAAHCIENGETMNEVGMEALFIL